MYDTNNTDPVTISSAADLLAVVPYVLGFRPIDSLVLIGLDNTQLVVTARLDLEAAADRESGNSLILDTVLAMARAGVTVIIAALYVEHGTVSDVEWPHALLAERIAYQVARTEIHLADCLLVTGGRWWSYLCTKASCCTSAGQPMPVEPTPFEAAAIYAGAVVADTREDLAERITPDAARDQLLPLLQNAAREPGSSDGDEASPATSVGRIMAAVRTAMASCSVGRISDDDVVRLGVALQRTAVRDAIWSRVDQGDLADATLWVDLARRLPSPFDAAPLFLYAWHCWRLGNGAMADIAVDRCLDSDPDYSAAHLLRTALDSGMDPNKVPPFRLTSEQTPFDT